MDDPMFGSVPVPQAIVPAPAEESAPVPPKSGDRRPGKEVARFAASGSLARKNKF